ncbi:hypothetical protein [Sphingobacterium thalpophilum]|uniref:Uncharacterized protein n=1 Tax=Sphingobacterium thalpophilum TaxID=259 RepID=A0A4U9VCU4_9SPHI|nr:hypothetical protein [Sphingobacterium thalpophilum]VTR43687.1 Uncharacterised protein [Sphingobacterium thalpophilum]
MAKLVFISPIQLYNINAVRRIRIHFNLSASQLSKGIGKSANYIGTMENEQNEGSYSDEVLSEIVLYINKLITENPALELEFEGKTHYTIYDLYPSDVLSNEKVVKKVDPIPLGSGPTVTLNAMIESTDFFKSPRTLKEIVEESNKVQNRNWVLQDFTQPLENAVKGRNKRLKVVLKGDVNTYILINKQKKV